METITSIRALRLIMLLFSGETTKYNGTFTPFLFIVLNRVSNINANPAKNSNYKFTLALKLQID